jgi:PTS system ascorbate-specific IIC component
MLIGQIVPAFEGISSKVVKGALPAYDARFCSTSSQRGDDRVSGRAGLLVRRTGFVQCFPCVRHGDSDPLIVTCFFECGAAAVIAEGQGGLRGTIIGTAVASVVMVGLVGVAATLFSHTVQYWMLVSGGNDFSLFGSIAVYIDKLLAAIF